MGRVGTAAIGWGVVVALGLVAGLFFLILHARIIAQSGLGVIRAGFKVTHYRNLAIGVIALGGSVRYTGLGALGHHKEERRHMSKTGG